jgi:hypothetical protein
MNYSYIERYMSSAPSLSVVNGLKELFGSEVCRRPSNWKIHVGDGREMYWKGSGGGLHPWDFPLRRECGRSSVEHLMSGVHCFVFRTLTSVLHVCGSSNPFLVLKYDVDGQILFR